MYAEFIKYFNADNMVKIIFSVTDKNFTFKKTTIKPLVLKCSRVFQVESFDGKKAFHKNLSEAELLKYIKDELISNYREVNIINAENSVMIKQNKSGKIFVKDSVNLVCKTANLTHNKEKNIYLKRVCK